MSSDFSLHTTTVRKTHYILYVDQMIIWEPVLQIVSVTISQKQRET